MNSIKQNISKVSNDLADAGAVMSQMSEDQQNVVNELIASGSAVNDAVNNVSSISTGKGVISRGSSVASKYGSSLVNQVSLVKVSEPVVEMTKDIPVNVDSQTSVGVLDYIKKYWYILVGVVVIMIMRKKRR